MTIHKEKTTINLPNTLKEEIKKWKTKLGKSQSEIISKALQEYFERKESERWEKGFELASQDKDYMRFCREMGNDDGWIY